MTLCSFSVPDFVAVLIGIKDDDINQKAGVVFGITRFYNFVGFAPAGQIRIIIVHPLLVLFGAVGTVETDGHTFFEIFLEEWVNY